LPVTAEGLAGYVQTMIHGLVISCNRPELWVGRSVIVLLAGIAIVMLIVSEIAALAPTPGSARIRVILLWSVVPVLVIFAAAWLIYIKALLSQTS
jgi:hypothetical protein